MRRSGASKRPAPSRQTLAAPGRRCFTMPPPANDNRPPFSTVLGAVLKWGLVLALLGAGLYFWLRP